jgi:orotate phosphoribosyltransferase
MRHIIPADKKTSMIVRLDALGVILSGHFVLESGAHSGCFIDTDEIWPNTKETFELCRHLAFAFEHDRIDAVIGLGLENSILAYAFTWHLSHVNRHNKENIFALHAKKTGDSITVHETYRKKIKGNRIVVVEDVLTTGISAKGFIKFIRGLGGDVTGFATIWNRGSVTPENLGCDPDPKKFHLFSLINYRLDAWKADEADPCLLCAKDVPINTSMGMGSEYLARMKKQGKT